MTKQEADCYIAAVTWYRRGLVRRLKNQMQPRLPFYRFFSQLSIFGKFFYSLLVIAVFPVYIAYRLVKLAYFLLRYPYDYLATYFLPANLRSPGERNIQGIHNSFSRFFELPIDLYISCIDEWVKILYGPDALRAHRMEFYLDLERLQEAKEFHREYAFGGQIRRSVNVAREQLSKALGYYS